MCLNTVQSSLVTGGCHGCTGKGGVLFNAALSQLGFTNFLVLLHVLSPRQKEKQTGRVCLPQREKGGQLEVQPGVVTTETFFF